jgi:hypothetical protein
MESWLSEYPCVKEHFQASGGVEAERTAAELLRFFDLTRVTDKPLAMVNKNIDLLWHKFIEFTELYTDFCEHRYGAIIHHRPRTATSAVPASAIRNFYSTYSHVFGPLPPAWEEGTPNEIARYGLGETSHLPAPLRWSGWPGRPSSG